MSDLLGSILDNMTKPPSTINKQDLERRRLLKKKRAAENALRADRVKSIEQEVEEFVTGPLTELAFSPTDKEWRAIQHEVGEIGGLITVSCYNGPDKDKHVTLFKKESCPSEEELKKRRLGERYIEGYCKPHLEDTRPSPSKRKKVEGFAPNRNYQDKYKRMLDTTEVSGDHRQYHGLVPVHMLCSEPKSIEDSLNEIREKKKQKMKAPSDQGPSEIEPKGEPT